MYQKAVDASAAGEFLAGTGKRMLAGVSIKAGADAATAVVRETDVNGRILAVVGAGIGLSEQFTPASPVEFTDKVFVVKTGTTPIIILYEG